MSGVCSKGHFKILTSASRHQYRHWHRHPKNFIFALQIFLKNFLERLYQIHLNFLYCVWFSQQTNLLFLRKFLFAINRGILKFFYKKSLLELKKVFIKPLNGLPFRILFFFYFLFAFLVIIFFFDEGLS